MTTPPVGNRGRWITVSLLLASITMVSTHLEAAEQTFEPLRATSRAGHDRRRIALAGRPARQPGRVPGQALPLLQQATGADFAALVSSEGGHWTAVAKTGVGRPLPIALLADVLDRESAAAESAWVAAPLVDMRPTASCCCCTEHSPERRRIAADDRSPVSGVCRRGPTRSAAASRSMLGSSGWKRSSKSPANGARPTRWSRCSSSGRSRHAALASDRASIFLWDRPNRMLVGRPALGVEGGELRIPDDRGWSARWSTRASRAASAATKTRRDRSPGRSPARLSNPDAVVRAFAGPLGRAVRCVRSDQQARRRFSDEDSWPSPNWLPAAVALENTQTAKNC